MTNPRTTATQISAAVGVVLLGCITAVILATTIRLVWWLLP